jgi:biopolymer transport protein ExbD
VWSPSQAAAQRIAKRRPNFHSAINFWPFAGVMVALLFVFLSEASPFHRHLWYPVDLSTSVYASSQRKALREDALRISIARDGKVFFGNMRIVPEDLPGLIHDALQEGSEKKVYLAVDTRSKYGDTARIVDQIRLAGIERLCFLTQRPTVR